MSRWRHHDGAGRRVGTARRSLAVGTSRGWTSRRAEPPWRTPGTPRARCRMRRRALRSASPGPQSPSLPARAWVSSRGSTHAHVRRLRARRGALPRPSGMDRAPLPSVVTPLAIDPHRAVRLRLPVSRHPDEPLSAGSSSVPAPRRMSGWPAATCRIRAPRRRSGRAGPGPFPREPRAVGAEPALPRGACSSRPGAGAAPRVLRAWTESSCVVSVRARALVRASARGWQRRSTFAGRVSASGLAAVLLSAPLHASVRDLLNGSAEQGTCQRSCRPRADCAATTREHIRETVDVRRHPVVLTPRCRAFGRVLN